MPALPYLKKTATSHQMIVKGEPKLLLGGELQNSSMSSARYMKDKWQKLVDLNVNFVLGTVSWAEIEPEEDKFDFTELDECIEDARAHNLHLGLLWFGSFKNAVSSYVPRWVKQDTKRFVRQVISVRSEQHSPEVLSVFQKDNWEADQKAFTRLMAHIKEFDQAHSTVILIQVENEVGVIKDSRDRSDLANQLYNAPVPQELIDFITNKWDTLNPLIQRHLDNFGALKTNSGCGNWEDTFGKGVFTDEIFMAYHYARYLENVTAAGKKTYPITYYSNCWQNSCIEDFQAMFSHLPEEQKTVMLTAVSGLASASEANFGGTGVIGGGQKAGFYPSGGPLYDFIDIWHEFAPSLSFLAPDIYMNDFTVTCRKYRHGAQPLFIPEMRRDSVGAALVWSAFGSYQAIGTCPFGIDTLEPDSPLGKSYGLLRSVEKIVLEAQARPAEPIILGPNEEAFTAASSTSMLMRAPPTSATFGFFFDEVPSHWQKPPMNPEDIYSSNEDPHIARFGDMELQIFRSFTMGRPSAGAGMIIHQGGYKFLLVGWGFRVKFRCLDPHSTFTGILSFKEKEVVSRETGELRTIRVFNGDETMGGGFANMPALKVDMGDFFVPICVHAETAIAEVEAYVVR